MLNQEILSGLNDKQMEAVMCTEGPLLVLAGAGSGKTRVITHRIAYLISSGVSPWNILAITFTNKAADEMRVRVNAMLPEEAAARVWVSTFHSMCVRILHRDIEKIGYGRDFTIYDADDQRTLIRQCIKALNLDNKTYREKAMQSLISRLKNEMTDPKENEESASDFYDRNTAKIYYEYERRLKQNNALDFDDLLLKTVELLEGHEDVLKYWQERFKYIMIDEYQDTNNLQFKLTDLLASGYKNLCVVGDDDQSIYKFRGANVGNILNFEKAFAGASVVKLEQNYRSTGAILDAANEVIKNNRDRKEKRLWTRQPQGLLPEYHEYETASDEASHIIRQVLSSSAAGVPYKDQAVLYRTNAQSRLLEERCVGENIPYTIVGGVNFYQRREIKDLLSYLRTISNDTDDLSSRRIVNVPKRGIGATTVERIATSARQGGISFFRALCETSAGVGAVSGRIRSFTLMILKYRQMLSDGDISLSGLIESLINETGYADELKKDDPVSFQTRLENLEELKARASDFESQRAIASMQVTDFVNEGFEAPTPGQSSQGENGLELLEAFLGDVSLVADIDWMNETDNTLTLMTLHAAKGLEFDTVYMSGMEEGLFPSAASINADDPISEIEEERRLCYVGITRAKRRLILSSARERMLNGELRYTRVSRFIDEIPDELAHKHFLSARRQPKRDPFSSFGGYEGRMERETDGGYEGRMERETEADGGYTHERAYSAYNSFNQHVYGNYGSLDRSLRGKTRTGSRRSSLESAGVRKGFNAVASQENKALGISKQKPGYGVGDRVRHIKFGFGTVKGLIEGERDYKVTVDFDEYGTKVMYAAFAKLVKC